MAARVDELLAALDPVLHETVVALGQEAKLRQALRTYSEAADPPASSASPASSGLAFEQLVKQARPVLADAGAGKRRTNELLESWKGMVSAHRRKAGQQRQEQGSMRPSAPSAVGSISTPATTLELDLTPASNNNGNKSVGKGSRASTSQSQAPTSPPTVSGSPQHQSAPTRGAVEATPHSAKSNTAAADLDLSELVDVLPGAGPTARIVATSQVSRFALDASETASLEVRHYHSTFHLVEDTGWRPITFIGEVICLKSSRLTDRPAFVSSDGCLGAYTSIFFCSFSST